MEARPDIVWCSNKWKHVQTGWRASCLCGSSSQAVCFTHCHQAPLGKRNHHCLHSSMSLSIFVDFHVFSDFFSIFEIRPCKTALSGPRWIYPWQTGFFEEGQVININKCFQMNWGPLMMMRRYLKSWRVESLFIQCALILSTSTFSALSLFLHQLLAKLFFTFCTCNIHSNFFA